MFQLIFLLILLQGATAELDSQAHVPWPAPESLARDLRSADDTIRLKALALLGVPKAAVPQVPSDVQLRFTSLDNDSDRQAILTAQIDGAYLFGAVAVPKKGAWQRIASFSCWCKYENGDLLSDFIRVEFAADGKPELVVHDSGGGTGLYEQSETRFRLRRGELRSVLSFIRVRQECPPNPDGSEVCRLEHRVFSTDGSDDSMSILIETKGVVDATKVPDLVFTERELQPHYTSGMFCKAFKWSEAKFRYMPVALPKTSPCRPQPRAE